ncbi:DUF3306 domain-containing protein [Rhodoferax sp. PAMC 29310]|uniref:DUF3306 domain-containing protein n=1 Tax=Rhodoferax sp. PAMC 29310 TaxID=2822760 RepID=UPI001B321D47|nr:DUF3306 domain-containing protein [Rhodoferax sp. PAMC 29310]
MADGFLGRWSQRKQAVAEGKPLAEPVVVPKPPAPVRADATPPLAEKSASTEEGVTPKAEPPVLSLDDVKALTPDDSYAPFVNRAVAPDVRNAAMKKLFTDPHYNVMDGLDIYIDDYSKPDPLPASMLRKMASAHFLKLFDDDDDEDEAAKVKTPVPVVGQDEEIDPALTDSASPTLPESDPLDKQTPDALDETQKNDYLDLRLQPNHAAGPQEPGRGTE